MQINKEFFILGEPVETVFGRIRFLTYKEYLKHVNDVNLITITPLHLYYQYKKSIESFPISEKEKKDAINKIKDLKKISLYDFVHGQKNTDFQTAYMNMYKLVMDEMSDEEFLNALDAIEGDEETFMEMRKLFMEMNMLQEEKVVKNELLQSFFDKSKEAKSRERGKSTLTDLLTSVVVGAQLDYETVKNMTVLQVHATYYRLTAMKNHEASVIWSTIPSDKPPKIEDWAKHIDLFETEKTGMSMQEFNKRFGSLL